MSGSIGKSPLDACAQSVDRHLVLPQNCAHWPQFENAKAFDRSHIDFLLHSGGAL
jgi:pimeloyl-ACP methyl ester carboxylesterase